MNESDRKRLIMEYISKNEGSKGLTEYEVSKYMSEKRYCARETTKRLIFQILIPTEKKLVDKKLGNSFHRLFINRSNDFNKLVTEMNRLEQELYNLNDIAVKMMKMIKGPKTLNLIHLAQLIIFRRITVLVSSIEKQIKSNDDREVLYQKLPDILKASIRLNEIIFPEVFSQALRIRKKKGPRMMYSSFIEGVVNIFTDSDLK